MPPPVSYKVVRAATAEDFEPLLNAAAADGWVVHTVNAGVVGPKGYSMFAVMEKKPVQEATEPALGHSGR